MTKYVSPFLDVVQNPFTERRVASATMDLVA
jgi:hypothetical protein